MMDFDECLEKAQVKKSVSATLVDKIVDSDLHYLFTAYVIAAKLPASQINDMRTEMFHQGDPLDAPNLAILNAAYVVKTRPQLIGRV